ncbi:MAG: 4Fe-4S binding protein [Mycoplasmoidaceae bacterium]|nr:4Fe-4S binding protein [Mycoplasmoidaceae bacterium]
MGGYTVTESCRSCIGHACKQACPKNAISIDASHRAHIDKDKCVNCGLCAKACPFGAIYNFRRPCQKACPVGAITMDENLSAKIDYTKCIACGACTQKCPFGAIAAKTFMTFVIDHIRNNILATKKRPIFAIVAPSIAAQFSG